MQLNIPTFHVFYTREFRRHILKKMLEFNYEEHKNKLYFVADEISLTSSNQILNMKEIEFVLT